MRRRGGAAGHLGLWLALAACASGGPDPERYRLSHSGAHWDRRGDDPVFASLQPSYPAYFAVILDPSRTEEPDLRPLRNDLERRPVDRRNYDALNAVAIGYFELNYRAASDPGGATYLADNFRAAKLLAIPWRAYGEIEDAALRDAIVMFFEDAGSGEKLGTAATASRLAGVVASLEPKEPEAERRARLHRLSESLKAKLPPDAR
jgi:hypothetical protein